MDFLSNLIKRPNSTVMSAPESNSPPIASKSETTTSPQISLTMDRCNIDDELDNLFESAALDLNILEEQHNQLIDNDHKAVEPFLDTPLTPRDPLQQLLSDINVNLDQVTAHEMEHLQAMSLELNPLAVKSSPRHSMEQQKALVAAMRSTSQPGTPTVPPVAVVGGDPFRQQELEPGMLKFTGLPEFDETQIPELLPLSVEMEAQLKADESVPTVKPQDRDYNSDSDAYDECCSLNSIKMSAEQSGLEAYSSALNEVLEHQMSNVTATTLENTLSEPDMAALSHNDSCEPMDVDMEDICDPLYIPKDEFAPENLQMLQEQILSVTMHKEQDNNKNKQQLEEEQQLQEQQLIKEQQEKEREKEQLLQQIEEQKQIIKEQEENKLLLQQQLNEELKQQQVKEKEQLTEELRQQQEKEQEQLLQQQLNEELKQQQVKEKEQLLEQQLSEELKQQLNKEQLEKEQEQLLQQQLAKERQEKEQQLEEQQIVKEEQEKILDQQLSKEQDEKKEIDQQIEQNLEKDQEQQPLEKEKEEVILDTNQQQELQSVEQLNEDPAPIPTSPPIPTHRIKTLEELQDIMSMQQFEQKQPQSEDKHKDNPNLDMKPLQLNMIDSSQGGNSGPTSPVFPIKSSPEKPAHFPRSPHAPVEQEEMTYLEQAVIEPSADHKLHLSGAISKSPLPIQVTVTQPSPEKPQEEQKLNATIPMGNVSPLNGTFDSAHAEILENIPASSRSTFGVPLAEAKIQDRRTFSLNEEAAQPVENQQLNGTVSIITLNDTYAMPLHVVNSDQRRTFSMPDQQKEQLDPGKQLQMRRTFCVEPNTSPAMEATEENILSDAFEPMDVDESLRVETTVLTTPQSPPIPTHQPKANFPSESMESQEQHQESNSPPIPTHQQRLSPPLPAQLKRPSIHGDVSTSNSALSPNATVVLEEQTLSAKEQLSVGDEKDDVYVDHFGAMSPISDDVFKAPQHSSSSFTKIAKAKAVEPSKDGMDKDEKFYDAEFHDGASNNNLILNSSDFDYLYTKGSNDGPIDRSSLLLRFDPLLGTPVPVNQAQHQQQQELTLHNLLSNNNNNNQARALSPTLEEHETSGSNQSFVLEPSAKAAPTVGRGVPGDSNYKPPVDRTKKHAKMSVDVIDNDCNKTFENSNLNSEDKTHKYHNMDELEKKIKNEVTRSEDIEKKLKDAEQREEALVKRITEKDKTNTKLNGVIEAYEKAIAELIHDKEQLVQMHDRQMQEVQADRDSNYHHLTSLETTFSDLHVKYEKSKEMTSHLKQDEENLLEEKKKLLEKLRQQEQRYEQMKSHAMQQMEIANKKLATITKEHTDEVKKLKALLKKEEVSRISTAEQLQQKSRENADLLKICEELIYDKGQGGSS